MPIPVRKEVEKRQTARVQVYTAVKDWITYGTLQPGEWINQQELSEYFGVSRIPVREALQMLEAQRLVEILPSKGTCVTEIHRENQKEWYQPLAALHALAAEVTAETITDAQLKELEKLENMMIVSISRNDSRRTQELDEEFHNKILEIAGNEFITSFSETLMLHVRRTENFRLQDAAVLNSFSGHGELMEALRTHDKEKAAAAMKENWLTSME